MDPELKKEVLNIQNWLHVQSSKGGIETLVGCSDGFLIAMQYVNGKTKYSASEEYILTYRKDQAQPVSKTFSTLRSFEFGSGGTFGDADIREMFTAVKSRYR